MQLGFRGVEGSGIDLLDGGITGFTIHHTDQGTFLYSTTGRNGGIVGYRIDEDGALSVHSTIIFPDNMTGAVDNRIVITDDGSGPMVVVGTNQRGLMGFALDADGGIGSRGRIDWDNAAEAATLTGNGVLEAWVTMSDRPLDVFPLEYPDKQIVSLQTVQVGGNEFVLTLCSSENRVSSFLRNGENGQLAALDKFGAEDGLGIHAPTAMEVVQLGGEAFVIVASAGTSSLSVMQLGADGSLRPTDQVLDTGATRFASVQAMTSVTVGDHAFIIAGGGDHGLTLFTLLPDGTLLALDTVTNSAMTALHNVSAIDAVVVGNTLHVFAGSQRDEGVNHFTLSLAQLGQSLSGTPGQAGTIRGTSGNDILIAMADGDTLIGGGGDDILVAGPGTTVMRGGGGANIFVMRDDSGPTRIRDFQAGIDRLDLSDWPMLRSAEQLTFTITANGARIEYRDMVVRITAADGGPLGISDVLGAGFHWPDRIPIILRSDLDEPGQEIFGTNGNDEIIGTEGDDTIHGLEGDDLIYAGGGNNLILAGPGNNTIYGGDGNDTIRSFAGDDLIHAGGGNNLIHGGRGNNTIYGGDGNDTIRGQRGDDLIFAGGGDNLIRGGRGNNTIHGGDGNDTIFGQRGDDLILAGDGDNLIRGGRGNNTIEGGTGNDRIFGQAGADLIIGGGGDNLLNGGRGRDTIIGGDGDDTIVAGPGRDMLWGGGGADTFIFRPNHHTNRIMDFNPEEGDILRLAPSLFGRFRNDDLADNIQRFGRINDDGDLVLRFADANTRIILVGFSDKDQLIDSIDFL